MLSYHADHIVLLTSPPMGVPDTLQGWGLAGLLLIWIVATLWMIRRLGDDPAGPSDPPGDVEGNHEPSRPEPGVAGVLQLGQDAASREDYGEAVGWFETAIAIRPRLPVAHLCLGLCLVGLQRVEEAVEAFQDVLQLTPRDPSARYLLAQSLARTQRPREALDHLRRALDAVPGLADHAWEDEAFGSLRDDPRFLSLVDKL